MLKIWGRRTSSNVQKVLWCCAELGLEYERVDLGGPFGGNQDPEYLALNPNGLVPTVKDGDLVMWDNRQVMHRVRRYDESQPRDMRRTTVRGNAPTTEQVPTA